MLRHEEDTMEQEVWDVPGQKPSGFKPVVRAGGAGPGR